VSNALARFGASRSFLDRTRAAAIPDHCGVTALRACNRSSGALQQILAIAG
jgi:hypothetical protein